MRWMSKLNKDSNDYNAHTTDNNVGNFILHNENIYCFVLQPVLSTQLFSCNLLLSNMFNLVYNFAVQSFADNSILYKKNDAR